MFNKIQERISNARYGSNYDLKTKLETIIDLCTDTYASEVITKQQFVELMDLAEQKYKSELSKEIENHILF